MMESRYRAFVRREHLDEMTAHALAERPDEACGLLGGQVVSLEQDGQGRERVKDVRVERVYRTRNAAPPDQRPVKYEVDPRELLELFNRRLPGDQLEHVGIYHSHVFVDAYPSATDRRQAYYPDAFYFLVTLKDDRNPRVRAFRIFDGDVHEAEIVVDE